MKMCFTKNCLKRALRTFLQTAVGYVVTNLAMYFGDLDFSNDDLLKSIEITWMENFFLSG